LLDYYYKDSQEDQIIHPKLNEKHKDLFKQKKN